MYKFGIYLSVVQVTSAQQNGSKFTAFFSYSPVSLMVFIRSSSKDVSYSSIVQFSDLTPFSASGFFGYQLKKQEIFNILYKHSQDLKFLVVFLLFYKVVQICDKVE